MAKKQLEFDYFHDYESEQFAFYRIPKVLFTDDYFRNLSSDAKVLYGLMLDRMALSIRNRWVDDEGKVYIIFTVEQVIQYMNCGRDKGMKIMAELDCKKGIGLIERVKQGFGKPDLIYVNSFVIKRELEPEKELEKEVTEPQESIPESQGDFVESIEVGDTDFTWSEKPTSWGRESRLHVVGKTDLSESEKPTYRGRENRSSEVGKTDPNNTDINNTDFSETNLINLSREETQEKADKIDGMTVIQAYTDIVKSNIDYEVLCRDYCPRDKDYIDEIVQLLVETISVKRESLVINGAEYPYEFVKSKLLKIDSAHVQYVLERMHETTTKIRNVRAYLLVCLFNAPSTINSYYRAEVNHDLYGGGNI